MEAKELRIGNLIMFGELRHECKPHDILNLYQSEIAQREISEYKPIPLTEEWLVKFGFEKNENETNCEHWHFGENPFTHDYMIQLKNTGQGYFFQNWHHRIKYVHQLQNIYFALTGEELTA